MHKTPHPFLPNGPLCRQPSLYQDVLGITVHATQLIAYRRDQYVRMTTRLYASSLARPLAQMAKQPPNLTISPSHSRRPLIPQWMLSKTRFDDAEREGHGRETDDWSLGELLDLTHKHWQTLSFHMVLTSVSNSVWNIGIASFIRFTESKKPKW